MEKVQQHNDVSNAIYLEYWGKVKISFSHMAIVVLFLIFIFLVSYVAIRRGKSSIDLPPGPLRLPIIGNFHLLKLPLHESLAKLSATYGDLMFLQLGSVPTIVVSSKKVLDEISKSHDHNFSSRPTIRSATKIDYGCSFIFAQYGSYWREIRKLTTLELLSSKKVQSFDKIREEEVAGMVRSIAESSGAINVTKLLNILTSNIICRAAFGSSEFKGKDADKLSRELQNLAGSICIADFFPRLGFLDRLTGFEKRLEDGSAEISKFSDEILEFHRDPNRSRTEHEDLVDVLLHLQEKSSNFSDNSIKAIIQDFFMAATDTSLATMEWTMVELVRNPDIMKKVQDEVDGVVKNGRLETSDVGKLSYLKMVIKESLRLHPVGPLLLPRETIEQCIVKGYKIPAKTRVFVNASVIHMDGDTWENPHEFKPERFSSNSMDFRGQSSEYVPFGFGRRVCPGIDFSSSLAELGLGSLLYNYDWRLPDGVTVENMNMEEDLGFAVKLKYPLTAVPTLRLP